MTGCQHCGEPISVDAHGVYVDGTGGDVCCADEFTEQNQNGSHQPEGMIVIRATDRADLIRQLLPVFYHDEDNDGQVVLYTDCQFTVGDGSVWKVVPMDPDEVDTGLCGECGLEAYDPDCGCVCNCHHTCG